MANYIIGMDIFLIVFSRPYMPGEVPCGYPTCSWRKFEEIYYKFGYEGKEGKMAGTRGADGPSKLILI